MKGYVAIDKDGSLWFHYIYPRRENDIEKTWWGSNDKAFQIYHCNFPGFENLTWDDEPIEAELTIKRTDK